ncbi:uncharacterized protein LOC120298277 [Crotalus tigris]|uniref:uncharacterized protein LOC120298277 n=1 Tax=Crotalus tigris TaxID=88082 RepID=UPI00192F5CEF|nr:uncharacterized protein LOC120298277 [Crotalus tigris]
MSEERVVHSTSRLEEDTDDVGEEQSTGCFQGPGLCCCIPTRRMSLPGRRPKERKGKNGKKNANLPSLDDIMFQEGQQNRDRESWSMASVGDLGSLQIENLKPAPIHDDNAQEPHRPVLLSDIFLEDKKGHDDKANANVQAKACEQKEALDDLKIPLLETGRANSVNEISEVKGHPVVSVKENRQSGKLDLNVLIKEVAYKKEHNEGGDHMNLVLQVMPCKKEMNQGHQDIPLEELQKSRELELDSTLTIKEKILLDQSTSTDPESVTSLQELLNQSSVLYNEEEKFLEQQELAVGAAHNREKPIISSKLNSSSEGDAYSEDQICQNEAQKPIELKYPDILFTVSESHEEERAGEQQHLHPVAEASLNHLEHMLEWNDQSPVIPQGINIPCQSTSSENFQKEIQAARRSTSNIAFIKVDDHQYVPYNLYEQTTAPESMILPLNATSTTNLQMLDNINSSPEVAAIHITEQKHPETQEHILLEQINPYDQSKEKEQHSEVEDAHFGSKATEEQQNQEPIVFEDFSKPIGNIRFEKGEQRKLDCVNSGSEGTYDKEEQDCQDNPCTEVQQLLIVSKLTSFPLNSSEEPCEKKDSTIISNQDIHFLHENPEEQDGQCIMSVGASSDEKEATLEPKGEWLTMPLPLEGDKEDQQSLEQRHIPEGMSIPHEGQQDKEELNMNISCEKQQRKEKEDLSHITFSGDAVQDEGLM